MDTGPVIAELVWDIPANNVVVMDIWLSASSREGSDFLIGFKATAEQLAYNLRVVPHYHIFSLQTGHDFENMCTSSDGRFCADDPDGGGPVTGKDVAIESARQLCIWDQTAVPDPEHPEAGDRRRSWKYWEYVTSYMSSCALDAPEAEKRFGSETCSNALMEEKGIDAEAVKSCLISSMDEKLKAQTKNLAWSKYAVRLNGWRFAGAIEPEGITRAICSAYISPVKECDYLIKPHTKLGELDGGGLTFTGFLFMIAVALAMVFLGLVIYKKFFFSRYIQKALREEVMLEVQTQLADYVPLEERT